MYVIYTFIYVFDFFEDASTTVLLFNLKQNKVYVRIYIKNHFIYIIIIMYILKQIEKFRAWQRTTPFPYWCATSKTVVQAFSNMDIDNWQLI